MCPSYMAWLEGRHSRGGRGNALRLAITGQLGAAWSDPGTLETLDLCLSCKGCKTECPSNVDIARLKAGYLGRGYRGSGRVPLKARVFGHVRALNRWGSIAPGVANWVNRLPVTRWVLGKALGFARQRSVPEFGRALTARVMDSRDGVGSARPDVAGEALPQTPPSGRGTERALPGESGVRSAAVEETLPQPPPSGRGTERARPGESGARSAAVEETLPQPPPLGRGSEETGQHAPRAGLTAMDGTLPQPPPSGRGTEKGVAGDGASASGSAPTVVVFGDCFTTYNEPRIGLAAKRVLEAFGYRVRFVNAGCCGRAMISTGLLADAIGTIDATLERLGPVIEDQSVRAVVVCEPSCLSAIKDDWLELKVRTPRAVREKLAGKSWLVEEFLEREWGKHPRTPVVGKAQAEGPRCVLHGHCHQKALWGVGSSAGLLKRLLGDVQVLDSGCCGMAGSFGYTQEHYDLSMRIGELVLFPAVRESAGACVVAPGTSCRHQIRDGTGVEAVHPIEVVARVLGV